MYQKKKLHRFFFTQKNQIIKRQILLYSFSTIGLLSDFTRFVQFNILKDSTFRWFNFMKTIKYHWNKILMKHLFFTSSSYPAHNSGLTKNFLILHFTQSPIVYPVLIQLSIMSNHLIFGQPHLQRLTSASINKTIFTLISFQNRTTSVFVLSYHINSVVQG